MTTEAGRTAQRTPLADTPQPLALVVRPARLCPRCGAEMDAPTPDQVFCTRRCGKADNADKWRAASGAVWTALVAGAVAGLYGWDEIRTETAVEDSLKWAGWSQDGRRRRAEVMRLFGLEWNAGARAWQTK